MGVFLIGAMCAGGLLGLLVAAVLGAIGVIATIQGGKTRHRVGWCFGGALAIVLPLCLVAVHAYPYAPVRPGSDYDVAARNLFLQGLGYGASPGFAVLVAALATLLAPRKARKPSPESKSSAE